MTRFVHGSLTVLCCARVFSAQELDCIIIETSGVTDAQPLLDTLEMPQLEGKLRVDAVLTVVDSSTVMEQLKDPARGTALRSDIRSTCGDSVRFSR